MSLPQEQQAQISQSIQSIQNNVLFSTFLSHTPEFQEIKPQDLSLSLEVERSGRSNHQLWIVVRKDPRDLGIKIPQNPEYAPLYQLATNLIHPLVTRLISPHSPSPRPQPQTTPKTSSARTFFPSPVHPPVSSSPASDPPQLTVSTPVMTHISPRPSEELEKENTPVQANTKPELEAAQQAADAERDTLIAFLLETLKQERETLKQVLDQQQQQAQSFQDQLTQIRAFQRQQINKVQQQFQEDLRKIIAELNTRFEEQHNLLNTYRTESGQQNHQHICEVIDQLNQILRGQYDSIETFSQEIQTLRDLLLQQQKETLGQVSEMLEKQREDLLEHCNALLA